MYTYKIEQAIKAAAVLHQDQFRKGEIPLPYVTHLVATMMILRDYTGAEDTLVAALLHDTIEDTDYKADEIENDFGKSVRILVEAVTEPKWDGYTKLPWIESKKRYAEQLKKAPIEAVMISAADKSHNFRSMVEEYYNHHDRFVKDFGPDLDSRLTAYQRIANAINSRLTDGIVHEFNHTFDQYKNFILDVKKSLTKNSV